jgi:sugar phosphate isomerase/epimerase
MLALLFGRDDLTIFGADPARRAGLVHFGAVFRGAQWLGARVLVYGPPKNRRGVDGRDPEVLRTAAAYFKALGALAAEHGVCLCIEPLPRSYPCDFINDLGEALQFVEQVAEPGFGLHVDGASLLEEPDAAGALAQAKGRIEHFHLSEPGLAPVRQSGPTPLVEDLRLLSAQGYSHWVSIEMREPNPSGSNLAAIEESLREVRAALDEAQRAAPSGKR